VLDALTEIAFEPEFLGSRIEKERRAVLAEAQMMNTIEYRVDCQLLQYLHEENALGFRFPIGKTDLVSCTLGALRLSSPCAPLLQQLVSPCPKRSFGMAATWAGHTGVSKFL
jgi:hypothetical protein